MSPSDPSQPADEAADHAYFRAIEDAFIRLRGAPFLLSPEDWRVAAEWRAAGVPVDLVERVLERVLRQREEAEPGKARRIRSLRYFDSAVRAQWGSLRSVSGSAAAREAQPIDVDRRLAALAAALPDEVPCRADWVESILGLAGGGTEEVESALAELDRRLLASVREALSAKREGLLAARVDAGLARFEGRLSADEVEGARVRLERQVLRRSLSMPLLSLFAPAARGEEVGAKAQNDLGDAGE